MYYIKCKDCGKMMASFDTNFQFKGESGFYCQYCYERQCEERIKEDKLSRIGMFFEMFIILTLSVLVMCTLFLFIPTFGMWLGVPDWGGLIYVFFVLIVGASVAYSLS